MSLAAAFDIPLPWKDCQTGDMPAESISSLRGVVFEENVIAKLRPPASATEMGLQLTSLTVVATKLGWAKKVES